MFGGRVFDVVVTPCDVRSWEMVGKLTLILISLLLLLG